MNRPPSRDRCQQWYLRGFAILIGIATFAVPRAGLAQRGDIPSRAYFGVFSDYYDGQLSEAAKKFKGEGRGAIKSASSFWVDSICYHTMTGECYFHAGRYSEAIQHYDSALGLYNAFSDWMSFAEFQPLMTMPATSQHPTWGRSKRATRLSRVPDKVKIRMGSNQLVPVAPNTVTAMAPQFWTASAGEIVRCTCLAMRRKRELLGPSAQYDPTLIKTLSGLARRPCPPNSWAEAWIDIELGIAYSAVGKDAQAKPLLERGLMAGGEFDHPLTCVGLLELGRMAASQGDLGAAAQLLEEATYSAFYYDDLGVLEEAFRYGTLVHIVSNQKGIYPPLANAIHWARVERLTTLHASLLLSSAENLLMLGERDQAGAALTLAKQTMHRSDLPNSRFGARGNYLLALYNYQLGKIDAGDQSISDALKFQGQSGGGSLWLYHIAVAGDLVRDGILSDRNALAVYDSLLRDPVAADWAIDPLESLAVLSVPHPLAYEAWLEVAERRRELERLPEIADALRRHRFLTTLSLGGRILSLRWLLESPERTLTDAAAQERRDLLVRFPAYQQLTRKAALLRDALLRAPRSPEGDEARATQTAQLAEWAELSMAQETLLREIALRREPSTIVFPPRRTVKEIQTLLAPGKLVLCMLNTNRQTYCFLVGQGRYDHWKLGSSAAVQTQLATLLRDLGNVDGNAKLDLAKLSDAKWNKSAKKLLDSLFQGIKKGLPRDLDELIVVPDGAGWYLPFEILPVDGDDRGQVPLLMKTKVRYAPFLSLAVPDGRARPAGPTTGVVLGRLTPGADPTIARDAFEQFTQSVEGAVAVQRPLNASAGIVAGLYERLVVLDEIHLDHKGGPYDWSPIPLERGGSGNTVDYWMSLPWRGPDQIVLPAFHTAAESSFKKKSSPVTDGSDLFLATSALMASGARTILVSRWRTGGSTTFDLMREFVQELDHVPAAEAWQRSVTLLRDQSLDLAMEPRITSKPTDTPPKAEHPFFWGGYLLVDTGLPPVLEEDQAPLVIEVPAKEKPAIKEKPGAKPPAAGVDEPADDEDEQPVVAKPGKRGIKEPRKPGKPPARNDDEATEPVDEIMNDDGDANEKRDPAPATKPGKKRRKP